MVPINRLFPIREGFILAGLRPTKGYAEIAAGRLKVVRNGRRTYIRASEIENYISALETAGGQSAA